MKFQKLLTLTIIFLLTTVSLKGETKDISNYKFKDITNSILNGDILFKDYSIIETFKSEKSFIPDSNLVKHYLAKKPIWIPYLETLAMNIFVWANSRYLMGKEYSKISFKSIKNNFKRGWNWDADAFYTNMFIHPFEGSLYYNTARSSGYGYLNSFLVTLFGSIQWEYFMETEPPSINDLIMTTFAGAIMGEAFYRISNLFLNDKDTGISRFARESIWLPMNIYRGINRLIYGYSTRSLDYVLYQKEPYILDFSLGVNNVADGSKFSNGKHYIYGKLKYFYGNIFNKNTYKMMDYFSFSTEVENDLTFSLYDRLRIFKIDGVIYAKRYNKNNHNFIYGFHQYIDYLKNDIYKIADYTLSAGLSYIYYGSSKNAFMSDFKVGIMPMSAANSDYAKNYNIKFFENKREYNIGVGINYRFQLSWSLYDWFFSIKYYLWMVHTLDGAKGNEIIGMLLPSVKLYIFKRFYVDIQYLFYHRRGYYKNYKDIDLMNNEQRISIGFQF